MVCAWRHALCRQGYCNEILKVALKSTLNDLETHARPWVPNLTILNKRNIRCAR
ncbi:hypothetical protein VRRI112168_06395 [Vreelandella rituensis]